MTLERTPTDPQMLELAMEYYVDVDELREWENDLENNYVVRLGPIPNLFKVYGTSSLYNIHKTEGSVYQDLTRIAQWVVDTFPLTVRSWREKTTETLDEMFQDPQDSRNRDRGFRVIKRKRVYEAWPCEEPIWRSDPAFYERAKKQQDFPWDER